MDSDRRGKKPEKKRNKANEKERRTKDPNLTEIEYKREHFSMW